MFVGFNVDDNDDLAFLALVNIPAGTTIYFSDNEWNGLDIGSGGAWTTGEGFVSWTNDTGSEILAGSVIVISNVDNTPPISSECGTAVDGSGGFDMSGTNEVVYAYLGTNETTPTAFLSAIGNNGFTGTSGTLTGTGLTAGTNATSISGDEDIGVFDEPITNLTTAQDIANSANWTTQDGSNSQSGDSIIPDWPDDVPSGYSDCLVPLPINITSFTAKPMEANDIALHWSTASEENNDYFVIEHSIDGRVFGELNRVSGAGTTTELQHYQFIHEDALRGNNYYRLKQVDFDGAFSFSEVEVVVLEDHSEINLQPTLAQENIEVSISENLAKDGTIEVVNWIGQLVIMTTLPEKSSTLTLNVGHLESGHYFVRIKSGNIISTSRFVKL